MTASMALKAVTDFLEPTGAISFYGGEPLLNFNVLRQVVEANPARTYNSTTNGTTITPEIAEFLNSHQFSVILSLDGPEAVHNARRRTCTGEDTYEKVMTGLYRLHDAGVTKILLRSTFCPGDQNLLERVVHLNSLCDEGLASNVSVEPSCYCSDTSCGLQTANWSIKDVSVLDGQYRLITEWAKKRKAEGKPVRLHTLTMYAKRLTDNEFYYAECGAGSGTVMVSVSGELFACHRKSSTAIGTVFSGVNEEQQRTWLQHRITACADCLRCKLFGICGGICRQQSLERFDSFDRADEIGCAFRSMWIKHALEYVRS